MRYNSFLHIFPEQCAKYLHEKFKMHSELTVRELMVILKRIGIKTIKIHNNGKIYDVFYKREIDGIQDFEFLNNLYQYRRDKQISDEWSKEPLIDYTPELSNMQNASDELLKQDDVYYANESKTIKYISMKKDNKYILYESIMNSVAKEVKKALNEDILHDNSKQYLSDANYDFYVDITRYLMFICDNLAKLDNSTDPVLIKNIRISGTMPYTGDTLDGVISNGHISGLLIQEALVNALKAYINGYEGEPDDYVDKTDIIGHQEFDISERISIEMGRDNQPISDFIINYGGKSYNIQVKAVQGLNQKNPFNNAIRTNNNLGLVVIYDFVDNDIVINQIQIYIPDAEGTFDYISEQRYNAMRLKLDPSRAFMVIGPRIIKGKVIR